MAEANIFGALPGQFSEGLHGSAIDGGEQAAVMYYHTFVLSEDWSQTVAVAQIHLRRCLRNRLTFNATSISSLQGDQAFAQVRNMITSIANEMQWRNLQQAFAFWQIGFAGSLLCLLANSDNNKQVHPELLAQIDEKLGEVNRLYPHINIKPTALLREMWKYAIARDHNHLKIPVRKIMQSLQRPLVVLSVSATPRDQTPLDVDATHRQIGRTLSLSGARYHVEYLPNCRPTDLRAAIRLYQPAIINFNGHGADEVLAFQDNYGYTVAVTSAELVNILTQAKGLGLRAVVMNACTSAGTAKTIADAAGWAIGTVSAIRVSQTIEFSTSFYLALALGHSVDDAYEYAKSHTPGPQDIGLSLYEGD